MQSCIECDTACLRATTCLERTIPNRGLISGELSVSQLMSELLFDYRHFVLAIRMHQAVSIFRNERGRSTASSGQQAFAAPRVQRECFAMALRSMLQHDVFMFLYFAKI